MRAKLLTFAILCCTARLLDGQAPQPLPTRVGDVAAGKIVSETNGALVLDIRPCDPTPRLLQFHVQYIKREQGNATCPNGSSYTRVVVEQK